mmetsp:Transcript_8163/g.17318  ORF Transcript_8163/g.17318 Transcript_8163/m.17318 type:complete len:211 (+) Transcript_8163:3063-3695(+)
MENIILHCPTSAKPQDTHGAPRVEDAGLVGQKVPNSGCCPVTALFFRTVGAFNLDKGKTPFLPQLEPNFKIVHVCAISVRQVLFSNVFGGIHTASYSTFADKVHILDVVSKGHHIKTGCYRQIGKNCVCCSLCCCKGGIKRTPAIENVIGCCNEFVELFSQVCSRCNRWIGEACSIEGLDCFPHGLKIFIDILQVCDGCNFLCKYLKIGV